MIEHPECESMLLVTRHNPLQHTSLVWLSPSLTTHTPFSSLSISHSLTCHLSLSGSRRQRLQRLPCSWVAPPHPWCLRSRHTPSLPSGAFASSLTANTAIHQSSSIPPTTLTTHKKSGILQQYRCPHNTSVALMILCIPPLAQLHQAAMIISGSDTVMVVAVTSETPHAPKVPKG